MFFKTIFKKNYDKFIPKHFKKITTFQIEGMSCAVGCAKTIEEDISKMDGVQKSSVDFDKKTAIIEFDADKIKAEDLVKKAEAAADGVTYKVSNLVVTK
jgi:copper chaperone CopZ